jgi:hypothetical protein
VNEAGIDDLQNLGSDGVGDLRSHWVSRVFVV